MAEYKVWIRRADGTRYLGHFKSAKDAHGWQRAFNKRFAKTGHSATFEKYTPRKRKKRASRGLFDMPRLSNRFRWF